MRSRHRTNRAKAGDGTYRGSGGLSPGWITGRIVADSARLAASNGAGTILPPIRTAGLASAGPVTRRRCQCLGHGHLPQFRVRRSGWRLAIKVYHGVIGQDVLLGNHVDYHGTRRSICSVTLGGPRIRRSAAHRRAPAPPTHQHGTVRACADRHRIQPLIQRRRIMTGQLAVNPRQHGAVLAGDNVDMTATRAEARHGATRWGRSDLPVVDGRLHFGDRQRPHPRTSAANSLSTLARASASVINAGAKHDRIHHAIGDVPGGGHFGHPWQPIPQRPRDHQLMGGHP